MIHELKRISFAVEQKMSHIKYYIFLIQVVVSFASRRNALHEGDVQFFVCLETDAL